MLIAVTGSGSRNGNGSGSGTVTVIVIVTVIMSTVAGVAVPAATTAIDLELDCGTRITLTASLRVGPGLVNAIISTKAEAPFSERPWACITH